MDTHSGRSREPQSGGPALRLGIIGCGRVVERFHLPALRGLPAWTVAGLCDPLPERRDWAEQATPGAPVYESAEALLAGDDLHAVLIAAPAGAHAALAVACLERGLHVLVEKPGGLNPYEARRMQRAAHLAERLLWVGYNRRYRPAYQALRNALAGTNGPQVRFIRSRLSFSLKGWDPVSGLDPASLSAELVLYDVAVHQLDLIAWITGRAVQSVKVEAMQGEAGTAECSFAQRLSGGLEAHCQAAHSPAHQETLEVHCQGVKWLAHPSGLLRSGWLGHRSMGMLGAVQHWTNRKLMRLGLKADSLAASYRLQLSAFARAIRSGINQDGGVQPLPVHAALAALVQASRAPGSWIHVQGGASKRGGYGYA
jgi:predicted dehydrogenase